MAWVVPSPPSTNFSLVHSTACPEMAAVCQESELSVWWANRCQRLSGNGELSVYTRVCRSVHVYVNER